MNKTDHYRKQMRILKSDYNDIKTEKLVKKQIKIDKEYKESVRTDFINKRSGPYRFRVLDVLNYRDDHGIVYIRTSNTLKKKYEKLKYTVNVYKNLSSVNQCYVFFMRYKDQKFRFNETVYKFLYETKEDFIDSLDEDDVLKKKIIQIQK